MNYCIYLRKSRSDEELEKQGINTLEKHRTTLTELAKKSNYNIVKIYEEVVSGENLRERIQAQQMLSNVEKGYYTGVLVMEIERLARGDTIDQGIIAQTFKYSNTKIITPTKIYDPNNEFDEEYFEFGLFMSRREYKTINRRMQAGRIASIKKGNYIGSIAPYGYERIKVNGQNTLKINEEEAKVLKIMFNEALKGNSTGIIAKKLNGLGIKPRISPLWTSSSVKTKITNPIYAGFISWDRRKMVKKFSDGQIKKTRPKNKDYLKIKGIHEPIIDENTFNKVQFIIDTRRTPKIKNSLELKNPLSTLVKCKECGYYMHRKPDKSGVDFLICHIAGCETRSIKLSKVENEIIEKLKDYLGNKKIELTEDKNNNNNILKSKLEIVSNEIYKLKKQLEKIYNYFEREIYDNKTFLDRKSTIEENLKKLENTKIELEKENSLSNIDSKTKIIELSKMLDKYDMMNIKEKNDLLKSLIYEAIYDRKRGQKDFNLEIFPKI